MAIIVDKVQKRKDIALACKEIFFLHGIKDLTISRIAQAAGVGKGTIYDYFKNKDDIIFEIVNILILERNAVVEVEIDKINYTKDKIKYISRFFYSDEDIELRQLYKEFVSIALTSPNQEMIDFQTKCFDYHCTWLKSIIEEAIRSGEVISHARKLALGIFVTAEGMFIASESTNSIKSLKEELESYIDAIFELIEVQ